MNNSTLVDICKQPPLERVGNDGCECQPEEGMYDECSFLICGVVAVIVMVANGFMITKTSKLYDLIVLRYGLRFVLIANFASGAFGEFFSWLYSILTMYL